MDLKFGGFNMLKNVRSGGSGNAVSVVFHQEDNAKTKPPPPRGRSWSNLPNEESRKNPIRDTSSHRLQPECREQGTQAQQWETRLSIQAGFKKQLKVRMPKMAGNE